jgi:hypothetical protein
MELRRSVDAAWLIGRVSVLDLDLDFGELSWKRHHF